MRCGPVEPWDVDADVELTTLAWVGSGARWAAVAAYCSCFLKLLSGLGDELLRVGPFLPHAFLRETCCEARLELVPERLPRDLGKVKGPPRESPRALPKERAERAFLCDGGRRPLDGRGSWHSAA